MILSMTGYGKSVTQLPSKKITVEIKSLNGKNLDINTRMPAIYRAKELDLRTLIAKKLLRGKIDFVLHTEITGEHSDCKINTHLVKDYIRQLKTVVNGDEIEYLKMAVRLPDAVTTERNDIDDNEWKQIELALQDALENILAYRRAEGAILKADFKLRIQNLKALLKSVKVLDPQRIANTKQRLTKAMEAYKEEIDQNRFEQELIYYIEKYDITEELVRLENHLNYFYETLEASKSGGKKLGFISQEIGREINTIGSKANYAPMQNKVVQMKEELEKIKEQLLNVL